jgi:hypothetical protein
MGTGTLDFRRLVSAFHDDILEEFGLAVPQVTLQYVAKKWGKREQMQDLTPF